MILKTSVKFTHYVVVNWEEEPWPWTPGGELAGESGTYEKEEQPGSGKTEEGNGGRVPQERECVTINSILLL